jgi:hypothetical protein
VQTDSRGQGGEPEDAEGSGDEAAGPLQGNGKSNFSFLISSRSSYRDCFFYRVPEHGSFVA